MADALPQNTNRRVKSTSSQRGLNVHGRGNNNRSVGYVELVLAKDTLLITVANQERVMASALQLVYVNEQH